MTSSVSHVLDVKVHRNVTNTIPAHHVTTPVAQNWSSYLTTWGSSPSQSSIKRKGSRTPSRERSGDNSLGRKTETSNQAHRVGFKNPWPSWHKPTRKQVWDALEWGEDLDPCVKLAASHATDHTESLKLGKTEGLKQGIPVKENRSPMQLAGQLLRVDQPDFSFDPKSDRAKTTWLGHAGILVQFSPLEDGSRPLRCIFDPIFSTRSSPTQMAGPIRSYPPPCKVESLPPIDVFMMSHSHHDHLDYDTVMSLWKINKDWIRFVVPLGNKAWFVDCGIDEDRVIELDWWDSVELRQTTSRPLKIICTPCQHNSGRTGFDANETLWSSWYLEHPQPEPYRVYFAGDTGYQFHESSGWPPQPTITNGTINTEKQSYVEKNPYPSCPAFQEIADRLGSPDLLLLPVAVGATFSFLRSYVPLPDAMSPFPRHKPGLTAANHMPPWDAVHILRMMTAKYDKEKGKPPLAIAMHWGTFVPERGEVLKTLGQLEYACIQQDVQFGRSLSDVKNEPRLPIFLALNHGQSIVT